MRISNPLCVYFALIVVTGSAGAQTPTRHPLDALSAAEIRTAATVLRTSGRLSDQARFGTIVVQPRKKDVTEPRAARVIGFDWKGNVGFVAVVDLAASNIESFTVVDSEPPVRLLTIRRAEEIAHADARWIAALRSRNIDTSRVSVLVGLPERTPLPRRGTDRIVQAYVWLRDGIPDALVVNGLNLLVNLTQGRLDSIADLQEPLRMRDSAAFRALSAQRVALAPLTITQANNSAARILGNEVTWDRWKFRVGVDPRRGLEVHDVSFTDGARQRSVLYSGSISEIVAPYGDSEFGTWYPRDEGDYGMGIYSQSSAVLLNDVPANAKFLSATMHDHLGRPVVVPRAISIYERDGGVLWRHANISRRARQLVISGHSTIDNYDYQFNWIFNQDGEIDGEVLLSGIMNINTTKRQIDTAHAEGHDMLGHLVAPGVNAPNHQHFFSYRLDVDVDGAGNTVFAAETTAPDSLANPKGELIAMSERPLLNEQAAEMDVSFATMRAWRVVNTHQTNTLGQFTGYTLVPGSATPAFARVGSEPMRTAGFIAHQLWVTPYASDELYAGGEFQNLGLDNQGLPTWTKSDRSIADKDVVLWYTLGITHIPRPEDWP
ncbi:MAG: hypothetical protein ABJB66_19935, partial [Gemmatimonadaceae bacterium]